MTKNEFVLTLTIAIGEAFARHVAAAAKTPEGKKPAYVRPVKMKNYFSDEDAPSCLDYVPDEDFISVRYYDGNYVITFFATNGFDFTIKHSDYWLCVNKFTEYFLAIYKA
jgi:hypothetical protein